MNASKLNYQADGFVNGLDSRALKAANQQLAAAKRATPAAIRGDFCGVIRRCGNGYSWFWVIR